MPPKRILSVTPRLSKNLQGKLVCRNKKSCILNFFRLDNRFYNGNTLKANWIVKHSGQWCQSRSAISQFCYLIGFLSYNSIDLILYSSAYIFSHLFQLGSRALLEGLYLFTFYALRCLSWALRNLRSYLSIGISASTDFTRFCSTRRFLFEPAEIFIYFIFPIHINITIFI